MERNGVVEKEGNGWVLVRILPDNCKKATGHVCMGCGQCSQADDGFCASVLGSWPVGTTLRLELIPPNPMVAGGFLFGMPVVGLFVGGIVGNILSDETRANYMVLLGAGVGFLLSVALIALGARFLASLRVQINVLGVQN